MAHCSVAGEILRSWVGCRFDSPLAAVFKGPLATLGYIGHKKPTHLYRDCRGWQMYPLYAMLQDPQTLGCVRKLGPMQLFRFWNQVSHWHRYVDSPSIILMDEISRRLIEQISPNFLGFSHAMWCRMLSIASRIPIFDQDCSRSAKVAKKCHWMIDFVHNTWMEKRLGLVKGPFW